MKHLKLPGSRLKLIQPLTFGTFILLQLMVFLPFYLHLIPELLHNPVLLLHQLLRILELTLHILLSKLNLIKLCPDGLVVRELPLQILDPLLMLLFFQNKLQHIQQPLLPQAFLQVEHLLSRLQFLKLHVLEFCPYLRIRLS